MTVRPGDLVLTPTGLLFLGRRFPVTVGRGGIRADKREGDGATPAGVHCCDSDMAITIDGMTYTGVFAVLPRETDGRATLTFSAIGGNQAIWGARIEG